MRAFTPTPRLALALGALWLLLGCTEAVPTPAAPAAATLPPSPAATATATPQPSPTPSPSPPPAATATPAPTPLDTLHAALSHDDQGAFVGETIDDYTKFAPAETFTKTWTLRNTGETTWTPSYALVQGEALPAGADWGAPPRVPLPQSVAPDEEITLAVPLTAPREIGIYTLFWALVNPQGEIVPIDGGRRVWVTIRVCAENLPCPTPQAQQAASQDPARTTVEVNGVSASLLEFTADAQQAVAKFCMTYPNSQYVIQPPVVLQVDGQQFLATAGSTLGPATSPNICYVYAFPATEEQIAAASRVAVVVPEVRMGTVPNPDARCQTVHDHLVNQYAGLEFTCHFSADGYFTDLQTPSGMSAADARQMIIDAIEGAIEGPWVLWVR